MLIKEFCPIVEAPPIIENFLASRMLIFRGFILKLLPGIPKRFEFGMKLDSEGSDMFWCGIRESAANFYGDKTNMKCTIQ